MVSITSVPTARVVAALAEADELAVELDVAQVRVVAELVGHHVLGRGEIGKGRAVQEGDAFGDLTGHQVGPLGAGEAEDARAGAEEQVEDLPVLVEDDGAEAVGRHRVEPGPEVGDVDVDRQRTGVQVAHRRGGQVGPVVEGLLHQGHAGGVVDDRQGGLEVALIGVEGDVDATRGPQEGLAAVADEERVAGEGRQGEERGQGRDRGEAQDGEGSIRRHDRLLLHCAMALWISLASTA
jgi:hypothetical protein